MKGNSKINTTKPHYKNRSTNATVMALDATGYSPVRLTPAVGVTSGTHYQMSTGHSSLAQDHASRRGPIVTRRVGSRQFENLEEKSSGFSSYSMSGDASGKPTPSYKEICGAKTKP